jgi:hypothetical protein
MYLGGETARFDRGIVVGPILYLRSRVRLEHEDAPQSRVLLEWTGDYKFVFAVQLSNVGHVFVLQLFTGFLAKLRRVGGAIQQYEEILSRLGARIGLGLSKSRVRNREQAQQEHMADGNSSHTQRLS